MLTSSEVLKALRRKIHLPRAKPGAQVPTNSEVLHAKRSKIHLSQTTSCYKQHRARKSIVLQTAPRSQESVLETASCSSCEPGCPQAPKKLALETASCSAASDLYATLHPTHTCMHTHTHACIHAYTRTYKHTHMHTIIAMGSTTRIVRNLIVQILNNGGRILGRRRPSTLLGLARADVATSCQGHHQCICPPFNSHLNVWNTSKSA